MVRDTQVELKQKGSKMKEMIGGMVCPREHWLGRDWIEIIERRFSCELRGKSTIDRELPSPESRFEILGSN